MSNGRSKIALILYPKMLLGVHGEGKGQDFFGGACGSWKGIVGAFVCLVVLEIAAKVCRLDNNAS